MAPDYLDPNGGGATETLLHSLTAPQNFTNFSDQYYELLEAVDEGMIIVVDTETDLTAFEGGSHDDVFAFVKGTGDFYVSSGGTFDSMNVSVDFSDLTDQEVTDLRNALDEEFLLLTGGTMQGNIDMNGNNVNNASKIEAEDQMVLPIK